MNGGVRLDLRVPAGDFEVALAWETGEGALGLFGRSGAGKTTVLEALAGLRPAARGRIEVGGRVWLDSARGVRLPPEARGVGYVPQDLLLFPQLDVLGNLRFGARRGAGGPRRLAVERILELLELGELARRPVARLSGGERQRVALGRALGSAPDLLLLDEPLASLDLALRRRILPYLLRVREELGIPTLHVSHDPSEMTLLAREVTVLEGGRVVARGAPEQVFGGHALATAAAGGEIVNVLAGRVTAVADSLARVEVEPGLAVAVADDGNYVVGAKVAFELRGGDILLALGAAGGLSAQNVLAATVREVHLPAAGEGHAGAVVTAVVGREARPLSVVVTRRACRELGLAPGLAVHLVFKAQACRLLATY